MKRVDERLVSLRKGAPDCLFNMNTIEIGGAVVVLEHRMPSLELASGEPVAQELDNRRKCWVLLSLTSMQIRINGSESSQKELRPKRVRLTNLAVRSSPICLAAVWCDMRQGVEMSLMVTGVPCKHKNSTILR